MIASFLKEYDHGVCPDCKRRKQKVCPHQQMEPLHPEEPNSDAREFRAKLMDDLWDRWGSDPEMLGQLRDLRNI